MTNSFNVKFVKSVFSINDLPEARLNEIVFSGRSNVGKSSVINSLLNRKNAARVSALPGRTQSINYFLINNNFYFSDLPGYGFAKVPQQIKRKWNALLDKYLNENEHIKLFVQILDFRRLPDSNDLEMINWLKSLNKNFIIVLTKCDKLGKSKWQTQFKQIIECSGITAAQALLYSSKTRKGVTELWDLINNSISRK